MPDEISYLDAAAWSPFPLSVRAAGEAGLLVKSRPWAHPREAVQAQAERARAAAARLIGATADDVAIVGSVSHAMATVAANLAVAPGGRVLRVADEFPSLCYAFDRLARASGLIVEEVPVPRTATGRRPCWRRSGAPGRHPDDRDPDPVALDRWRVDRPRPARAGRPRRGSRAGDRCDPGGGGRAGGCGPLAPDFLAFPTYKWALGPYALAFLYAAPHRQDGAAIEENIGNRPPATGARRYDRGELNDPVLLPMAATGLELLLSFDVSAVADRLRRLTDLLADGLVGLGLSALAADLRAPNILGLRAPGGLSPAWWTACGRTAST